MIEPKRDTASDGRPRHYSVGAIIERDGSYLLFDRVTAPFGFNGVGGHVDEAEDADTAIVREVKEETGLTVVKFTLLYEEELPWDTCGGGIPVHHWRLYRCEVEGELRPYAAEARDMNWYTPGKDWPQTMIPQWDYWFKKLGVV